MAFYLDDMRALDEWDGSYDLITSFWNSLGYYDMEFRPRIYAPIELREMCRRAGFETIDCFGGVDGNQSSLDYSRVIVLAG